MVVVLPIVGPYWYNIKPTSKLKKIVLLFCFLKITVDNRQYLNFYFEFNGGII
jgi:hypothetical protein